MPESVRTTGSPGRGASLRANEPGLRPVRRLGTVDARLEYLQSLAREVCAEPNEPLGVYCFRPESSAAALPLSLEDEVLEGALAPGPAALAGDSFTPYDDASLLICVLDHRRGMPAAAARLVLPSHAGLKSLQELPNLWGISAREMFAASEFDYDPNHTWDLASLMVAHDYRAPAFQGTATLAICQAVSLLGLRTGFRWTLALLHLPVLRMLQWRLHRPFNEFTSLEPTPYLDSPATLPAWMHLGEWHRRLAARDPHLHQMMVEGTGLEPAVKPLDVESAAELAAQVSPLADQRVHLR
ncbi:MAG: hypothetical protein ACRDVP_08635 [Acidimicrobiales bacterium]